MAYLVCAGRPVAREQLVGLFWSDSAESEGRHALRRALYNLAVVVPGCIEADRQTVTFVPGPDVAVDLLRLAELERDESSPPGELYDLQQDLSQRRNLYSEHPEVVAELTALLARYVAEGRSTSGPPQRNDVLVEIRKPPSK